MRSVSLETRSAINKHWNNKFYYTVASCWLFLYDVTDQLIPVGAALNRIFVYCTKYSVDRKYFLEWAWNSQQLQLAFHFYESLRIN